MKILGHKTQDVVMRVFVMLVFNHIKGDDTREQFSTTPEMPLTYRAHDQTGQGPNQLAW